MALHSSRRRSSRRLVLGAAALTALVTTGIGVAASLGVTSAKLTTYVAASSVPGCTSPGTQTASANADSWIDQSSSSSNFGTDAILKVRSQSGGNYRALVRFSLPAQPSGCTVTLATLRLYAVASTTGRTLQALQLASSWSESGVTWSNQPATTGTAATTTSGLGYREWAVTSQVQAMYSGANDGFLVRDQTEDGGGAEQSLHSREKAPDNPPELVITFG